MMNRLLNALNNIHETPFTPKIIKVLKQYARQYDVLFTLTNSNADNKQDLLMLAKTIKRLLEYANQQPYVRQKYHDALFEAEVFFNHVLLDTPEETLAEPINLFNLDLWKAVTQNISWFQRYKLFSRIDRLIKQCSKCASDHEARICLKELNACLREKLNQSEYKIHYKELRALLFLVIKKELELEVALAKTLEEMQEKSHPTTFVQSMPFKFSTMEFASINNVMYEKIYAKVVIELMNHIPYNPSDMWQQEVIKESISNYCIETNTDLNSAISAKDIDHIVEAIITMVQLQEQIRRDL